MPGPETVLPTGAVEIEYDPGANLALRHAGEKFVFVLSSNPDEILNPITRFAEDTKTSATVLRLADVIRAQAFNQVATTEAQNAAMKNMDNLIVQRIDVVLDMLENDPTRDDLVREIEALRILVENLR